MPTDTEIIDWIEVNPEAIRAHFVRKDSFGRKTWWRGPNGNDYDTLRECAVKAMNGFPLMTDSGKMKRVRQVRVIPFDPSEKRPPDPF